MVTMETIYEMLRTVNEEIEANFARLQKLEVISLTINKDGTVTTGEPYELLMRLGRHEVLERWAKQITDLAQAELKEQGLLP